jgi:hypothetical protein
MAIAKRCVEILKCYECIMNKFELTPDAGKIRENINSWKFLARAASFGMLQ